MIPDGGLAGQFNPPLPLTVPIGHGDSLPIAGGIGCPCPQCLPPLPPLPRAPHLYRHTRRRAVLSPRISAYSRAPRGWQFAGQPSTREPGGPARGLLPTLDAWKGAKFVRQIEFVAEDKLGFWEVRGYSNTADPWTEDRFS